MHLTNPRSGKENELWAYLRKKWTTLKAKKPDRREYTLLFVPHHGRNVFSLRIPILSLKATAAVLGVVIVVTIATLLNYRHAVNVASADKAELDRLKQVNSTQGTQIEQLAKATAVLQEDINRINKLDADLRRMVNSEDLPASRSGVSRPGTGYGGQGGPAVKPDINQLTNLVQELHEVANAREQSLTAMKAAIAERNARLASTPSIWPAGGEVTSRFGWRSSPWGWSGGDWHPGLDIANDYGTSISATADGEVVYSGWYGGYGKMIQIDHGNGLVTVYGHNSENLVNVGDKVKKGQEIAHMGSTGYSTGTHVHYEVRVNGTAVNPANYL